jgi:putative endonuclease
MSKLFTFHMYFVYILRSLKDRKYYIGSSSDVAARLAFHNAGRQRSTRHRTPFELVHTEVFATKEEALMREKQIKSFKGGLAFQRLIQDSGGGPAAAGH